MSASSRNAVRALLEVFWKSEVALENGHTCFIHLYHWWLGNLAEDVVVCNLIFGKIGKLAIDEVLLDDLVKIRVVVSVSAVLFLC